MKDIFKNLKGGLIVSCQAEGDSPFNNPIDIAKFAKTAMMGGAVGLRTEGVEKTLAIKNEVKLPLISLKKAYFEDGYVKITGDEQSVIDLIEAGADIIAIDGTNRKREDKTGSEFISYIKGKYDVVVMADIATYEEARLCKEAGADCISTTLSGYTPETNHFPKEKPDYELLKRLVEDFGNEIPIIAEGKFNSPKLALKAIKTGAWSVVVGTAITRPHLITKWFVDEIEK